MPRWLRDLAVPGRSHVRPCRNLPRHLRLCKEIFAGSGGLSVALAWEGLSVGRPLEAFPRKHVYLPDHDIISQDVFDGILPWPFWLKFCIWM